MLTSLKTLIKAVSAVLFALAELLTVSPLETSVAVPNCGCNQEKTLVF